MSFALLLGACASGPRPIATTSPSSTTTAPTSATTKTPTTVAPVASTVSVVPRPGPAPASERDAADAKPPVDLASVPDAEPKIEAIRSGGANKAYEVQGQRYLPQTNDAPFTQRGLASWYGRKFHGRRTASGEVFDMYGMSAAHRTLPLPSYVRVRNPANGAEVVLRVNDRGPFHSSRIIDLSYTAAQKLGVLHDVAPVEVVRITGEDIRTGVWREGRPAATRVAQAAPAPVSASAAPAAATALTAPAPAPSTTTASAASPMPLPALPADPPVVLVAATASYLSVKFAEPVVVAQAAAPPGKTPALPSAHGFWVQLGAFQRRSGADSFHGRVVAELDWLAPVLAIVSETRLFRLQAGPYGNRDEAMDVARRVREALQLVPQVLQRR